jgi:hypothetical protein
MVKGVDAKGGPQPWRLEEVASHMGQFYTGMGLGRLCTLDRWHGFEH